MRPRPTTAIRSWKTTTSEGRSKTVRTEVDGAVLTVTLDRPEVRNAVDPETARALEAAFSDFNANDELSVALLTGATAILPGGCDPHPVASGSDEPRKRYASDWWSGWLNQAWRWPKPNRLLARYRPFRNRRCVATGAACWASGHSASRTRRGRSIGSASKPSRQASRRKAPSVLPRERAATANRRDCLRRPLENVWNLNP